MKTALKIFGFAILVSLFYSYVGQTVPQKITYPPESAELSADMSAEELAAVGEELVGGKGTCLGCHTIGSHSESLRFPDLGGIGAAASGRVDGQDDVTYLAESMYEPNKFIVEGFLAGMPAINKPPIGLTDDEIKAVIAYLQSLGGTPTVTLATDLGYVTVEQAPGSSAPAAAAPGAGLDGPGVFATYGCAACHNIETADRGVGPSLYDTGSRMSKAEIYESIVDPDAVVAEGYPAGVMGATLTASGFFQKVSTEELKALVDYLADQKGG
ncbi:MAG: cytochrome c [Rhodothermales bacterium]|nr:cytochrome c [Rhodothermales bacterium]